MHVCVYEGVGGVGHSSSIQSSGDPRARAKFRFLRDQNTLMFQKKEGMKKYYAEEARLPSHGERPGWGRQLRGGPGAAGTGADEGP